MEFSHKLFAPFNIVCVISPYFIVKHGNSLAYITFAVIEKELGFIGRVSSSREVIEAIEQVSGFAILDESIAEPIYEIGSLRGLADAEINLQVRWNDVLLPIGYIDAV